jgi:hypothetical protein
LPQLARADTEEMGAISVFLIKKEKKNVLITVHDYSILIMSPESI